MKLHELEKKIQEVFPQEQSKVLKEFIYFLNDLVKVSDFNELKAIVKELAEAQKRTEQRVEELAEAQKELANAQKRTEQELKQLANELRLTRLELKELVDEHKITRQHLGGLSHSFGYLLEDRAYKSLPGILEKQFGIKMQDSLKRNVFTYKDNVKIEINIIGTGIKDGREIWIIGEAKSQLKKKHIDSFVKKRFLYDELFSGDKLFVMVTHMTYPDIKTYAENQSIYVFYSYELPL